ncbi:S1 family peptidase [Paenibacillus radicis (ex Xue et al. 2023)]|uniref:Serine protease n=1 Tax=Paenibacillus radicis (ex Xue et al. 2023) TaxID=2972489 RepID=A0ABT1YTK3_9BACL|nr:serine protease [Paenibacillus radicis (ex Xue et al. 2023)]MCR8636516.1 serine protease [Paenibacillus radicis (ex Xue et al. 2023)]
MKRKLINLSAIVLISLLTGILFFVNVSLNAKADAPVLHNAEEIYELSDDAVFYIRSMKSDGTLIATGTGVLLSPSGTAASAYHVIKEAERIEATFNDGRAVGSIEVLIFDELTDIAILKLPDPQAVMASGESYHFLPMREAAVKHGEKIFAVGYPLKNTPIITEGIINTPKAEINGRNRILTSAQIVSGMSGGPVIDPSGQLVGIISGSMRTMNNIHLVIDTGDIRSALQTIPVK